MSTLIPLKQKDILANGFLLNMLTHHCELRYSFSVIFLDINVSKLVIGVDFLSSLAMPTIH